MNELVISSELIFKNNLTTYINSLINFKLFSSQLLKFYNSHHGNETLF